jgi:hypothetical protein
MDSVDKLLMNLQSSLSRVRDLVDLHLLIASGSLDVFLCIEASRRIFERRDTPELPKELVPPPADWDRPLQVLEEECRIDIGYREAFYTRRSQNRPVNAA